MYEPFSTTSQEDWERKTHAMVENTTKELAKSKQLRSYFDVLMKQIIEDISKQVYRLNEIIRKRIAEYRRAKLVLEEIHKQSALKVNDVLKNIAELEKEMLEKEGYVRVCQMRLGSRAHRPTTELCDDKVEATLAREYRTLRETVINLNQMISEVTLYVCCLHCVCIEDFTNGKYMDNLVVLFSINLFVV